MYKRTKYHSLLCLSVLCLFGLDYLFELVSLCEFARPQLPSSSPRVKVLFWGVVVALTSNNKDHQVASSDFRGKLQSIPFFAGPGSPTQKTIDFSGLFFGAYPKNQNPKSIPWK
jgi:hypothetical protein